jgi:hypothetical protein
MTKKLKAITLTETLVYIAIFSIFMLTMMQFFISIQINQDKVYKEMELEMNKIFLINHFEENLKDNFIFDSINSIINGDKDTLVFRNQGGNIQYKISNNDLILERVGVEEKISNRKASIQSFYIEPILNKENEIIAVKINFVIQHTDNYRIQQNFSTLIKLVNYEG